MSSNNIFRAIYYPYSRCIYEVDLKRALLVFDEILFVDPLSRDLSDCPGQIPIARQLEVRADADVSSLHSKQEFQQYRQGYWAERYQAEPRFEFPKWYDVREIYKELQARQVIKLVDPLPYIKKHEQAITFGVISDLVEKISPHTRIDGEIFPSHYAFEGAGWGWRLHSNRIPNLLREVLSDIDLLKSCINQMDLEDMVITHNLNLKQNDFLGFMQSQDEEAIITPYQLAFSAILNQALIISEELQAFPITDDPASHLGLLNKASRIYSSQHQLVRSVLPQRTVPNLYRIQIFTLSVVSRLVPDEVLEQLDIASILNFRDINRDSLQTFRNKMIELSTKITSTEWSSDFPKQVLKIIDTEVIPEVHQIDCELSNSLHNFLGDSLGKLLPTATKTISPALPTLTMAALMALSPGEIVLLGATGLMSAIGMIAPDVLSYWKGKHTKSQNGLSFLVNFRNQYMSVD